MTGPLLTVEMDALTTTGVCDCCGRVSRRLTGYVHEGEATLAAYLIHWTVGHFPELTANVDLIMGRWGDTTSAADRVAVSLEIGLVDDKPSYRVIDAGARPVAQSSLVRRALSRSEVFGTAHATAAFALIDAISDQDTRLPMVFDVE